MIEDERRWRQAIEQTWVVRFPKQHLATFGATNISYYVITEPVYKDLEPGKDEGVIRTGRVIAERPTLITPTYALSVQGFSSEAYDYFRNVAIQVGPNSPGVLYQYRNEAKGLDIVGGTASEIAHRISADLDERKEDMSVVMVGVDELWDVTLLKFVYEFTSSSIAGNIQDFNSRGMLDPQPEFGNAPRAAIQQIERLFAEVQQGGSTDNLKSELDRWGLFKYYEDRFLSLFRRHR